MTHQEWGVPDVLARGGASSQIESSSAVSCVLRVSRVTSEWGLLTKRITLADDGSVKRITAATLTAGRVEVLGVDGLRGLAGLIGTLTPSEALMFGVLRDGATAGDLVTQPRLRQLAQSLEGIRNAAPANARTVHKRRSIGAGGLTNRA